MRAFKGIATRSFARAAQAAPFIADFVHPMLDASAKGAAQNCVNDGSNVACRLTWSNSSEKSWEQNVAGDGNLGEVLNALSTVQAMLWRTANAINGTVGSVSPNATTSGSPSGTSGSVQQTGVGATIAVSFTYAFAIAFAVVLNC